jgi:hypothetical protein
MIAFLQPLRSPCCPAGVLAVMIVAGSFAMAQNADPLRAPAMSGTAASAVAGSQATKPAERLREGTRLIDVTGSFQAVGADSVSFLANGNKDSYRVLENLALQRVSFSLEENRTLRQWIVSGTITEYRGANYLLLTKAVIQLSDGEAAANP